MCDKKISLSLPQRAYLASEVQQNEANIALKQGISLNQLMEMAGLAVFNTLHNHLNETGAKADLIPHLLIVCGKGNNGGDGFVVARLALQAGYRVTILLWALESDITGDALTAYQLLQQECQRQSNATLLYQQDFTEPVDWFDVLNTNHFDLMVDALLGTGFHGELAPEWQQLIQAMNDYHEQRRITTISIDVPSGLNANTGAVHSIAIEADMCVTFIALKKGLLTGRAVDFVGQLILAGLTINQAFNAKVPSHCYVQGPDAIPSFPKRKKSSHKGDIGLALCIGGNEYLPGAIKLSSEAALRSGAALVAVACHDTNKAIVVNHRPEVMLAGFSAETVMQSVAWQKAKVIIIGPGLGQDHWAQRLFTQTMEQTKNKEKTLVIDADGLQLLAQYHHQQATKSRSHYVLTPHPGEAAALLNVSINEIENNRYNAVKKIAVAYRCICVLKGAGTLISDGEQVWVNTSGNEGMASGGMGDVLSGIIAAFILQIPDPITAVRLAVYVHGLAADKIAEKQGVHGMLASDIIAQLPRLMNKI